MATNTAEREIALQIARLTREQVVAQIRNFKGSAALDFTEEFLRTRSLAHLKHILLAARLHLTDTAD